MKSIKYHKGMDFFHSLHRYYHSFQLKEGEDKIKYKRCIKYWKGVINEVPLMDRQLLKPLLSSQVFLFLIDRIIYQYGTDLALSMTPQFLIEMLAEEMGLDKATDNDSIYREFYQYLEDHHDVEREDYDIVYEMCYHPKRFLDAFNPAINNAFAIFEDHIYQPNKNKLDEAIKNVNVQYKKDPKKFMDNLMMIEVEQIKEHIEEIDVIMYYFAPLTFTMSIDPNYVSFSFDIVEELEEKKSSEKLQALLKLLADPKRYEMLKLLATRPYYGAELAKALDLSTATVSHHIYKFSNFKFIQAEKGENNRVYFSLQSKKVEYWLKSIIEDLLKK